MHLPWLLEDLYAAYYQARRNKRNTQNQLHFELNLERNLHDLYIEIAARRYTLSPGIAFVVNRPKIREIFAATFRDRVVHHLVYNYIAAYWERQFIYDSYSCRPGKGTHFGAERISHFLRAATANYTREAWVIKLDICSYFINMRRDLVWRLNQKALKDPRLHLDQQRLELLAYLLPIIIFADPTADVQIRGNHQRWQSLPTEKSLFYAPPGQGFPIGNLTSQLFSNIYLNELDQFIKRQLHIKYYGRYVDDFVLIAPKRDDLQIAQTAIGEFLHQHLHLQLSRNKVYLQPAHHGVDFIGARIRPSGIYPGRRVRQNYNQFLRVTALCHQDQDWASVQTSYLGHLSSYAHE